MSQLNWTTDGNIIQANSNVYSECVYYIESIFHDANYINFEACSDGELDLDPRGFRDLELAKLYCENNEEKLLLEEEDEKKKIRKLIIKKTVVYRNNVMNYGGF